MAVIPQATIAHKLLTDADRHTLIRPNGVATQRTTLLFLDGLIAERGGSRNSPAKTAAIIDIGVAAGKTLLSELLADNTRSSAHPHRLLTHEEWSAYNSKIEPWRGEKGQDPRKPLTCERLLVLLSNVRAELQRRRDAEALGNQSSTSK